MNEYDKVKLLEMAIQELRNAQLIIANKENCRDTREEKRQALAESREKISTAIEAISKKRREILVSAACSIANTENITLE